jgi:hypothetical protein
MLDCSPINLCRQSFHVELRVCWFGSHRAGNSLIGLRFVQQLQKRLVSGVGGAGGGGNVDDGEGDAAAVAFRTRTKLDPGALQGLLQYGEELCGALAVEKLYARPTLREFAHYLEDSGLDLTRLETGVGVEEERGMPKSAKEEEEEEQIGISSTEAMLCREAGACPLLSQKVLGVQLNNTRRIHVRTFNKSVLGLCWHQPLSVQGSGGCPCVGPGAGHTSVVEALLDVLESEWAEKGEGELGAGKGERARGQTAKGQSRAVDRALRLAAAFARVDTVRALLRRGASARAADATTGALPHLAAAGSAMGAAAAGAKADTVQALLAAGAPMRARDKAKLSALHVHPAPRCLTGRGR